VVRTFKRSNRLYRIGMSYHRRLDRDHDGIACESAYNGRLDQWHGDAAVNRLEPGVARPWLCPELVAFVQVVRVDPDFGRLAAREMPDVDEVAVQFPPSSREAVPVSRATP
jgi:hypothetical protein